jgi:hypothetical protein
VASIVEQIQRDALDPSVAVSMLLRRVKLAATKLGLGAVEDWVQQELDGYATDVPEYRIVRGIPIIRNPYRGWQPIGGSVERLSKRACGEPVAALEDLISGEDGTFQIRLPDAITARINQINDVAGWPCAIDITRSQLVAILDRVRTLVLDWALKLETAGVLGSDFNFDAAEKQKARAVATTINIGTIGSFAGNLGAGNASGNIEARDINVDQVRNLLGQLKQHVIELEKAGADRSRLEERVASLELELAKGAPDRSLLRGALTDIRNALSGAAGSLIASGALQMLNQILGTGMPSP